MKEIITITGLDDEKVGLLDKMCDRLDTKKKNALMRECILELKSTMEQNDLVSLSAPQIGYNCRIFCVKLDDRIKAFINPMITKATGLQLSRETCSSIPNKTYIRIRHPQIELHYENPLGRVESATFMGKSAMVVQHCVDHLDGLLLPDVGLEIDADFDNATDEERGEIVDAYLSALDLKRAEIHKDIESDAEAKKVSDAMKFMTAVENGEVVLSDETVTVTRAVDDKDEE